MKMAIGPAQGSLEDIVETTPREGAWDLDQPPNRRTNLLEGDPEFVNVGLTLRFRCHLQGHVQHGGLIDDDQRLAFRIDTPLLGRKQKGGYGRCRAPSRIAHALGRTAAESHLQNGNSDLLRDPMDHLKDSRLASSSSARKNNERVQEWHV